MGPPEVLLVISDIGLGYPFGVRSFFGVMAFLWKIRSGCAVVKAKLLSVGGYRFVSFEVRSFCVEKLSVDSDRYKDFVI